MAEKSQKTSKGLEKNKYSNAVNRTTSESLRLGDTDKSINHPTTLISSATNAKKKTSFQITSVTLGHSSNDGGDDSADDLDESHTEDNSDVVELSRMTDFGNETPSCSEDTFSKDDVFFNTSASLGTAPVIPTSSQYGLAIVDANENCGNSPSTCVNNISGSELHVTVPDSVINLVGVKHNETEMRDIHSHPGRNERFKVVKIESTEPFKRGRWICMDYLDHSMIQSQQTHANNSNLPVKEQIENAHSPATVGHQATDSGICMSDMNSQNMNPAEDKVPLNVDKGTQQEQQQQSTIQYINQNSGQTNTGAYSNPSPGQTMQSQPVSISNSQAQMLQQHIQSMSLSSPMNQNMLNTNQHQSLQAQQMQQVIASANMQMPQVPLPQQLAQPVQMQHMQQFQQPQQVQQQVIQPMQPVHNIQSQPMQVPQTLIQTIPQQPISAPANYPPTSAHIAQTMQMPVQTQPSPQTYPAGASLQQCPPQQMITVQQHPMQQPQYYTTQGIGMMPTQQQPPQMMTIPTQVAHQQSAVTMQQPYQPIQPQASQQQQPQQQSQAQQQQQQQQQMSIGHHVPATSMAGYVPVPTAAQVVAAVSQAAAMVPTSQSQSAATQMIQQMYGTVMQGQMFRNGAVPSSVVDAITSEPGVIERVVQSTGILETLANVASINNNESSETPAAGEDPESTSGASAVAIDNKIEQAMDLVKSHLMFAVREEVEVLKEKIAELMDRINHLEFENSFLKANASQETLAQLSSMPQPPSSSSGAP